MTDEKLIVAVAKVWSGANQVLVCNEETIGNGFNEQFICNKCFNTWSVDQPLAFTFYNQIEEDFDK